MRITAERKLVGNAAADTSRRHHRVIRSKLLRVIPEEEKARGLTIHNKGQKATISREVYRGDECISGRLARMAFCQASKSGARLSARNTKMSTDI